MFGIGFPELIVILIVALIVIGPKRLPETAKYLGEIYAKFKRALNDVKDSVDVELNIDNYKDKWQNPVFSDEENEEKKDKK